jgi:zinc protease
MQSWLRPAPQQRRDGCTTASGKIRGLNYGDYAYIEHFPGGMFRFEPPPNIARQQQIFQIWIRPVEVPTAHFALRLALFEFDKIAEGPASQRRKAFEQYSQLPVEVRQPADEDQVGGTRVCHRQPVLWHRRVQRLCARQGLAKPDSWTHVNRAIRKHLRTSNMYIVLIAKDGEEWKNKLLAGEPSPMIYNAPKPDDLLEEDKIVEKWLIPLKPENVRVVPVAGVFE